MELKLKMRKVVVIDGNLTPSHWNSVHMRGILRKEKLFLLKFFPVPTISRILFPFSRFPESIRIRKTGELEYNWKRKRKLCIQRIQKWNPTQLEPGSREPYFSTVTQREERKSGKAFPVVVVGRPLECLKSLSCYFR